MRRALALLLGFAYMVLLIEGIRVAVAWWKGELADPGLVDGLLLASLPVLAWIWWRHFSVFGCKKGCALPPKDGDAPPGP